MQHPKLRLLPRLRSAVPVLPRLRTRLGFGVHSPFAYRFITQVLKPAKSVSYYAYEQINAACRANPHSQLSSRYARCLFRVVCDLQPANIIVCGSTNDSLLLPLRLASPHSQITLSDLKDLNATAGGSLMLVVTDSAAVSATAIIEALSSHSESSLILCRLSTTTARKIWRQLVRTATLTGIAFDAVHLGIFVHRRGLPHMLYKLCL